MIRDLTLSIPSIASVNMTIAKYILLTSALVLVAPADIFAQTTAVVVPAPVDLSGNWTFEVPSARGVTRGAMTVFRVGVGYMGTLTTDQGNHVLPVQSLSVAGKTMSMTVASPQGNVVFIGALGPDGKAFSGEVTYHDGSKFPMSGRYTGR